MFTRAASRPARSPIAGATTATVGWATGRPSTDSLQCEWCSERARNGGEGHLDGRLTLTEIAGALRFVEVSAGFSHSCAVTPGDAAYCWGSNANGGFGDGTTAERNAPTVVVGDVHLLHVSAGDQHTCGVTTDHAVYCWGGNIFGQLGECREVGWT